MPLGTTLQPPSGRFGIRLQLDEAAKCLRGPSPLVAAVAEHPGATERAEALGIRGRQRELDNTRELIPDEGVIDTLQLREAAEACERLDHRAEHLLNDLRKAGLQS